MNEKQRKLKRAWQAEQRRLSVTPEINCLYCEHVRTDDLGASSLVAAGFSVRCLALGVELHRWAGAESVDFINAPAECPKRRHPAEGG